MYPQTHLFFGICFAILLFLFFPNISLFGLVLFLFSNVLIDFDHYVAYIFHKKDFNLKKAIIFFIERQKTHRSLTEKELKLKKIKPIFLFLHGVEIIIIIFFLGIFISPYFYYISAGFLFHLIIDLLDPIKKKIGFVRISMIYFFIKTRKQRKKIRRKN